MTRLSRAADALHARTGLNRDAILAWLTGGDRALACWCVGADTVKRAEDGGWADREQYGLWLGTGPFDRRAKLRAAGGDAARAWVAAEQMREAA